MTLCRSGAGCTSGNSSVSEEERKGRDQVEVRWGKKVQLPLCDKAHPIGILQHR